MTEYQEPSAENFEEISRRYGLGKIRGKPKLEAGGKANHNYELNTDSGTYMVRISPTNRYKEHQRKGLEYKFTDYLNDLDESEFSIQTPKYLKNTEGKRNTGLGENTFEVYERLPGEVSKEMDEQMYRELARTMGYLHKSTKDFPINGHSVEKEGDVRDWLLEKYEQMRLLPQDTELNKQILENIDFFENALLQIEGKYQNVEKQVVHGDLTETNVLFENGKLTGILDFDSINIKPKVKDIADSINRTNFLGRGYSKEKARIFLEEYKKVNDLSQTEIDMIVPLTIEGECVFFYWGNMRLPKIRDEMYETNKHLIKNTQKLLEEIS